MHRTEEEEYFFEEEMRFSVVRNAQDQQAAQACFSSTPFEFNRPLSNSLILSLDHKPRVMSAS